MSILQLCKMNNFLGSDLEIVVVSILQLCKMNNFLGSVLEIVVMQD